MSRLIHLAAMGGSPPKTAIEDVFSSYIYTGNLTVTAINNGLNLASKGGLVWVKCRDNTWSHYLGSPSCSREMSTNGVGTGEVSGTMFSAYNTSGFTLKDSNGVNETSKLFMSWSFAQADKFFKVAQVTVSGSNQTVDLSSLGTVGMVTVKRTDSTSDWYVWHRSCTAGKLMYLNNTNGEATDGSITVSGTTLTLVQATIGNGTFIIYAWAHDTGTDGLIQCGVYSDGGSTSVTLGWEPQAIIVQCTNPGYGNWMMADTMRGMDRTGSQVVYPNLSNAEATATSYLKPTATGFNVGNTWYGGGQQVIYMAIRRGPMKKPTVGTQVYNAIARTGTGATATVTGVGFAPDLVVAKTKGSIVSAGWYDRLRGPNRDLTSCYTDAEYNESSPSSYNSVTAFGMDGVLVGQDAFQGSINNGSSTYIDWFLRRYPGVFDVVCDTGTGSTHTITHNLGVAPELIIRKSRTTGYNWGVYYGDPTKVLYLNTTAGPTTSSTVWNDTAPTASVFTVATAGFANANAEPYVSYLFATLAGISKVGSYTGNGSSQTINCGFTAGARFILIRRTDSTGDWYVWDSTRGIVAGSDPHLSLNTTAAEVTSDDSIDPDTSGFIVNQLAATNINVTSATYIYLAFA